MTKRFRSTVLKVLAFLILIIFILVLLVPEILRLCNTWQQPLSLNCSGLNDFSKYIADNRIDFFIWPIAVVMFAALLGFLFSRPPETDSGYQKPDNDFPFTQLKTSELPQKASYLPQLDIDYI